MYKLLIRPILFCFDPEKVHYFTFSMIRFLCKIPGFTFLMKSVYEVNDKKLEVEIAGLKFKNPVGLAAGFDKDAKLYKELSNFGFGFFLMGFWWNFLENKQTFLEFNLIFNFEFF